MKPILLDSFDRIQEADLQAFEEEIGYSLPSDYQQFLLKSNGGTFRDDVRDTQGHNIRGFHGLNVSFDYSDLRQSYAALKGAFPGVYLPIADSVLGDNFFICLSGAERGKVVVWMHDYDDSEALPTPRLCSETFEAFYAGLWVDHEEDLRLMPVPLRAVYENDAKSLKQLLDDGEDVNWSDTNKRALLGHAAYQGRPEVITILLDLGADLSQRDRSGKSATFLAVDGRSVDCLQMLIDGGANINEINKRGESLLIYAIQNAATRSALALIGAGADVNFITKKGDTALSSCRNSYEIDFVAPHLRAAGAKK